LVIDSATFLGGALNHGAHGLLRLENEE
jgi:hypothetical protein